MSGWGPEAEARRDALAALERLIAASPPCTVEEATEALRRVVVLRDGLTARRTEEGASPSLDRRLECVNVVLSLVWSGTVPIVGFRRKHLEEAHAALSASAEADGNRTHHPG